MLFNLYRNTNNFASYYKYIFNKINFIAVFRVANERAVIARCWTIEPRGRNTCRIALTFVLRDCTVLNRMNKLAVRVCFYISAKCKSVCRQQSKYNKNNNDKWSEEAQFWQETTSNSYNYSNIKYQKQNLSL